MLAVGCFRFKLYALAGNQPRNLIRNDLCGMDAPLVKISSAINLDERITNNLGNLERTGKRLKVAVTSGQSGCTSGIHALGRTGR
jgi:hypothetical protein